MADSNRYNTLVSSKLLKYDNFYISGPRIDFQNEGAKFVLYLVSSRGASMVATEGNISYFGSLEHKKMHS